MKSSMMINIKLNDVMTTIYEEIDEALVRKDQNEVFKSLSYLEYLYINQEFSSEQITLRSSRYFKNIVRNKDIYDDYQIKLSTKIISKRYNLSYRRVEQLLY